MEIAETRAVVRAVESGYAVVEVEQGGCGRCHEKGGCGGKHLSQMLCSSPKTYRVRVDGQVAVGDAVTVAIVADAVRRGANLIYGIPLLGLLGGAGFGMLVGGDSVAIFGGMAGLAAAWLVVRAKIRTGLENSGFQPYIVGSRGSRP